MNWNFIIGFTKIVTVNCPEQNYEYKNLLNSRIQALFRAKRFSFELGAS